MYLYPYHERVLSLYIGRILKVFGFYTRLDDYRVFMVRKNVHKIFQVQGILKKSFMNCQR